MSDYSEHGAQPVDDAAVPDPPTVAEVAEEQARRHPEQLPHETSGGPPSAGDGADDEDGDGERR